MAIRRFSSRTHRLDASFLLRHLAGAGVLRDLVDVLHVAQPHEIEARAAVRIGDDPLGPDRGELWTEPHQLVFLRAGSVDGELNQRQRMREALCVLQQRVDLVLRKDLLGHSVCLPGVCRAGATG